MLKYKYLVAIPAFNEDRYLGRMLERARPFASDILVVDDGSTDQTSAVLQDIPDISVIRHKRNAGYGRSLIAAYKFAIGSGYDWVITMDCDEQHEPAAIPVFQAAADRDEADIISGSRYLIPPADPQVAPADRRSINRSITEMLNRELGLNLTDAFCGFKALRTTALAKLHLSEPGYAMPLEFWVQAVHAGLRVVEVPVRLIYNDPMRRFGGGLDDPTARLAHYIDVFERARATVDRGSVLTAAQSCRPC
jgi:dolichol-phosphate mannosyltransferase